MTSGTSSVFHRKFINIDNPLCSDIEYYILGGPAPYYTLSFKCVDVNNDSFKSQIEDFKNIIKSELVDFDINKIKEAFNNYHLNHKKDMENDTPACIIDSCVDSCLINRYLNVDINESLFIITKLDQILYGLQNKDLDYWKSVVDKWIIIADLVEVISIPDIDLGEKIEHEKQEIKDQLRSLNGEANVINEELKKIINTY